MHRPAFAIQRYAPGSGTTGDVLEFMTNSAGLEHWQNEYSATQPASDGASAGALSVGAIDPWNGTTIGGYSSQGPTNDNRIKPDVSAASCLSTRTVFTGGCFNGTSAATPVVAGAAALYIGATNATPAQVKTYLTTRAFARLRGARQPA